MYTCKNGLSCLEIRKASISWSIFLIRPGVRVTVDIAGEGGHVAVDVLYSELDTFIVDCARTGRKQHLLKSKNHTPY